MFELSIALKYLLPKWRQLSVSIISIISIVVISLVVWLILVFFSVTNGLDKKWIEQLITLTAPVRITPTSAYYDSYYYRIDSLSSKSNYSFKSIREKLEGDDTNPYDPYVDEEIPGYWPKPDMDENREMKDLVKGVFALEEHLEGIQEVKMSPFETSVGNLRFSLIRDEFSLMTGDSAPSQSNLSQSAYLGSFDPLNQELKSTLLPLKPDDLLNILYLSNYSNEGWQQEGAAQAQNEPNDKMRNTLRSLLHFAEINQLKTPPSGWKIPPQLYPVKGEITIAALIKEGKVFHMIAPRSRNDAQIIVNKMKKDWDGLGALSTVATLVFEDNHIKVVCNEGDYKPHLAPLYVLGNFSFPVESDRSSIDSANHYTDIQFDAAFSLQGVEFKGKVPLVGLLLEEVTFRDKALDGKGCPFWVHEMDGKMHLPSNLTAEACLLPKNFRESGVKVGDRGVVSYYVPTASSMQEQRLPVFVAGFYDQGVLPIGGRFVWVNPDLISMVNDAYEQGESGTTTGINVRFDDYNKSPRVKQILETALKQDGLDRYWKIETFREYTFTKDLLEQLTSQKNLFTLISIVIIVIACSNIVSMLIILVNDKKVEIGILRSMGAGSTSIALIFGLCGFLMGVLGSVLGIFFALITLRNLTSLVDFIGWVQGHQLFNSSFFGEVIPNELSSEALAFVIIATVLVSLIAGLIPAIKACLLKPSEILRSQ